jgi:hypothetical protein
VSLAPESSNSSASSNAKKSEKVDAAPFEMAVLSANSHSELVYEKPTAEDIVLAKSEGSSSLHIQAKETVARDFLKIMDSLKIKSKMRLVHLMVQKMVALTFRSL